MAAWSQVFDDGPALATARRRARGTMVGFALVSGALVAGAPLAALRAGSHSGAIALGCGVLLSLSATWVLVRLAREHRRVWRVEVSALGVAAVDAAGRRTALLWRAADHVDVSDAGLTVTGRGPKGRRVRVHARAAMPGYDVLARLVVGYAHAHRRPLAVEGRPVDGLSLDGLAARAGDQARSARGGSAETAG